MAIFKLSIVTLARFFFLSRQFMMPVFISFVPSFDKRSSRAPGLQGAKTRQAYPSPPPGFLSQQMKQTPASPPFTYSLPVQTALWHFQCRGSFFGSRTWAQAVQVAARDELEREQMGQVIVVVIG